MSKRRYCDGGTKDIQINHNEKRLLIRMKSKPIKTRSVWRRDLPRSTLWAARCITPSRLRIRSTCKLSLQLKMTHLVRGRIAEASLASYVTSRSPCPSTSTKHTRTTYSKNSSVEFHVDCFRRVHRLDIWKYTAQSALKLWYKKKGGGIPKSYARDFS